MATIHSFNGGILICASSNVFLAKISRGGLSIHSSFNARGILSSLSFCAGDLDNRKENLNISKLDVDIQILCSSVSNDESMVAIGTSEKALVLLTTNELKVLKSVKIPKAPTSVVFDKDDSHIIVGDRAGHVCRYAVCESRNLGYTDMNGEECSYEGEPLTGAISMILDVAVSNDGNFLFAADRDEKIRVSRYPMTISNRVQAFVVQSYCLGHTAYVSSLALCDDLLFSGGGDSVVIEWDVKHGKIVNQSAKLDKEPVRRVAILKKDGALFVIAVAGFSMYVLDRELHLVVKMKTSHIIMDVTVVDDGLLGVSSAGVTSFTLVGRSDAIDIPNEIYQALLNSKDPISTYFKNTVHQNTLDYYEKKEKKLQKKSRKDLTRKRKPVDVPKDVEQLKEITGTGPSC
ncbi:WD domain, G-beta repeat protein [Dictyocaulus viviparus]|uniref:tRNA (guanine-N(7)-)-methyltransferase non-catalytic subunit n=1 Tax=Dictyocaulus viviparus TaxID=29172 RepID=A0A0D8Y0S3_DICVI|nr:WD domain, G-beta repeat protein [Dictyocaulus viviparus]